MVKKLQAILGIDPSYDVKDWEDVENRLNVTFPNDYKEFINSFGDGMFKDFLWILSPFSPEQANNQFYRNDEIRSAYNISKNSVTDMFADIFEYDFYEKGQGLFPWGITIDGDELYWNFHDDKIDIVILADNHCRKTIFKSTMTEFLVDFLENKLDMTNIGFSEDLNKRKAKFKRTRTRVIQQISEKKKEKNTGRDKSELNYDGFQISELALKIENMLQDSKICNKPKVWQELFSSPEFLDTQFDESVQASLILLLQNLSKAKKFKTIPVAFIVELYIAYGMYKDSLSGRQLSEHARSEKVIEKIDSLIQKFPEDWRYMHIYNKINRPENRLRAMTCTKYVETYIASIDNIKRSNEEVELPEPYFTSLVRTKRYTNEQMLFCLNSSEKEKKKTLVKQYYHDLDNEKSTDLKKISDELIDKFRLAFIMKKGTKEQLDSFINDPVVQANKTNSFFRKALGKAFGTYNSFYDDYMYEKIYDFLYDEEQVYDPEEESVLLMIFAHLSNKEVAKSILILEGAYGIVDCSRLDNLANYLATNLWGYKTKLSSGIEKKFVFGDSTTLEYKIDNGYVPVLYNGTQNKILPKEFLSRVSELDEKSHFWALLSLVDMSKSEGLDEVKISVDNELKKWKLLRNVREVILDALFTQKRQAFFNERFKVVREKRKMVWIVENTGNPNGYEIYVLKEFYKWTRQKTSEIYSSYDEAINELGC